MNGVPDSNNDNDSIIKEIAPHVIIPKGDDAALIRLRAQITLRKIRASWLFLEYQVNLKMICKHHTTPHHTMINA